MRRTFQPSHQCPERGFRMLIMAEKEEEDGEGRPKLNLVQMELSTLSAGAYLLPKRLSHGTDRLVRGVSVDRQ